MAKTIKNQELKRNEGVDARIVDEFERIQKILERHGCEVKKSSYELDQPFAQPCIKQQVLNQVLKWTRV